jgi:outer membrane protein OmpA-like peptidoglycan-associated protein/opacity protein-like surface antigen
MLELLAGILLLVLVVGTPASAGQGQQGDWEFGPYAGFGWLDDYDILHPKGDAIFGLRAGYFFTPRWSLEGSWQRLSTDTDLSAGSNESFDLTSGRLNLLLNFRPGESVRPFVTAGVGIEKADAGQLGDSTDTGWNAGGGVRWYLSHSFALRLDGRYVWTNVGDRIDQSQGNIEATLGAAWSLGGGSPSDADRDGVTDRQDKCPGTPVGAKVDSAGCPVDSDHDGVADGIDQCPATPGGWPVDARGCPLDGDRDGVADGEDACPNSPAGAKVDARGCTTDEDDDGVFDGLDRCPATPRGARVDAYGCPIDSDHDGVPDGIDTCPDTKHGARVDAQGCEIVSKSAPLFTQDKKTLVLEGVNFETNSATLTPDSVTVLETVAVSLKDWPEVRVEIGGHTDSSGADAYNLELSRRRAESVKAYLAAKGIDESRLKTRGYGETRPIAENRTREGRARNRRVELTRVD